VLLGLVSLHDYDSDDVGYSTLLAFRLVHFLSLPMSQ
jgi:hypothetical protein